MIRVILCNKVRLERIKSVLGTDCGASPRPRARRPRKVQEVSLRRCRREPTDWKRRARPRSIGFELTILPKHFGRAIIGTAMTRACRCAPPRRRHEWRGSVAACSADSSDRARETATRDRASCPAHAPRVVRDRQRERFRPSAISGPSRSLDERLLMSDGPPFGEGMSKDDPRAESVQFLRHQIMVGSSSRKIHLSGSGVVYGNATRTLERYWRMLCEAPVDDVPGRCV
jgi:hypothetical protein